MNPIGPTGDPGTLRGRDKRSHRRRVLTHQEHSRRVPAMAYHLPEYIMTADNRSCPACGKELKCREAEICVTCGVRVRDPPVPAWMVYARAGIASGICTAIILAFLLGFWQGSLFTGASADSMIPDAAHAIPLPPATWILNTTNHTEAISPDVTGLELNDYFSTLGGGMNVSRITGMLDSGEQALYSFTLNRSSHVCTVSIDTPDEADFDIYLSFGSIPTPSAYQYRSNTKGRTDRIEIWGADPGTYFVLVQAVTGGGTFTLTMTQSERGSYSKRNLIQAGSSPSQTVGNPLGSSSSQTGGNSQGYQSSDSGGDPPTSLPLIGSGPQGLPPPDGVPPGAPGQSNQTIPVMTGMQIGGFHGNGTNTVPGTGTLVTNGQTPSRP